MDNSLSARSASEIRSEFDAVGVRLQLRHQLAQLRHHGGLAARNAAPVQHRTVERRTAIGHRTAAGAGAAAAAAGVRAARVADAAQQRDASVQRRPAARQRAGAPQRLRTAVGAERLLRLAAAASRTGGGRKVALDGGLPGGARRRRRRGSGQRPRNGDVGPVRWDGQKIR